MIKTLGKTTASSDEGSIAPLIFGFFMILMSATFVVSDISALYVARRDLISNTEAALYRATEELDSKTYYLSTGRKSHVPIDCQAAERRFRTELLREAQIAAFECDGWQLVARVRESRDLPFQLKILSITGFTNEIRAAVVAEYNGGS